GGAARLARQAADARLDVADGLKADDRRRADAERLRAGEVLLGPAGRWFPGRAARARHVLGAAEDADHVAAVAERGERCPDEAHAERLRAAEDEDGVELARRARARRERQRRRAGGTLERQRRLAVVVRRHGVTEEVRARP